METSSGIRRMLGPRRYRPDHYMLPALKTIRRQGLN
jgi:hypothetical protein